MAAFEVFATFDLIGANPQQHHMVTTGLENAGYLRPMIDGAMLRNTFHKKIQGDNADSAQRRAEFDIGQVFGYVHVSGPVLIIILGPDGRRSLKWFPRRESPALQDGAGGAGGADEGG
jgi:hypothetical protein